MNLNKGSSLISTLVPQRAAVPSRGSLLFRACRWHLIVDLGHGLPGCGSVRLFGEDWPRRNGAPLPLLVPCFLARTRPLLWPRRSMRRRTSEPAVLMCMRAAGSTAGRSLEGARPAATAILHGLARRTAPQPQTPLLGAAQAVGRAWCPA